MSDVSLGVLIALAAGLVNGSFAAPTKYTTRWKWENIWAVWAVVALFITPWLLAFLTIPDLLGFYRNTSAGFILMLAAFGFGVGRDRYWGDRYRHDGYRAYGSDCRVVRERVVTPSGRVIFRTHRTCDY